MSIITFYLHKAEQCARMARESNDQWVQAKFKEEENSWRAMIREAAKPEQA